MTKKIIFSGGGTGGHIIPAINLMKHFLDKKYNVLLVTDKKGSNFAKNYDKYKTYILKTYTFTNKNLLKKFFSFFLILYSVMKSILIIKKEKPDLIFGFGGYVSFPICFAATFFRTPLVIYENNMLLGRANKHLSIFSKKILIANKILKKIPEKYRKKTHIIGPILNKKIVNFTPIKKNYLDSFSILVLGGSQGAEVFGEIIPSVIKKIKDHGVKIEINQQCILKQKDSIIKFYNENNITNYIFEFEKDILKLILSSDLVITRCGASSTAELAYTCVPFIAVPLPNSIDNHQYLNAKYYEENGYCWLLEQVNFNNNNLFNLIIENIKSKNNLKFIKDKLKKNQNRNVYSNVESQVREYL